MLAPRMPATMPRPTQRLRPATPLVAASTMPTIRPASMTSRNTINKLASTRLLRDHHALRGVRMVFAHEVVAPGREWPQAHDALSATRHNLLHVKCRRVEFLRA